ncbi:MAG: hypothetical protein M1812_004874 [Candelaria pacifica]|nr:MAG: hypothetical protein M1812_004874 [Candelaria pacifica]
MPSNHIFLTGAPDRNGLTYKSEVLYGSFLPSFNRFIESRTARGDKFDTPKDVSASELRPVWRSIPLYRKHLPTGISQAGAYNAAERAPINFEEQAPDVQQDTSTSFFTTTSVSFSSEAVGAESEPDMPSSAETDEEVLSQFYEHSFAVHEGIQSSQIAVPPEPISQNLQVDTSDLIDTSFHSTDSDSTSFLISSSPILHYCSRTTPTVPNSGPITDLKHVPNAPYLNSITPQTMTVNLLVGIISIAPPRTIKTRRGGREMEIVEMLVGDETKAGFGMNFWLLPTSTEKTRQLGDNGLRQMLSQLRPQDIVLVRNAALSSFRGKVFGQSLRKNMTKLDLMYRDIVDSQDEQGAYSPRSLERDTVGDSQVAKAKRVRNWVSQFVGPGVKPKSEGAIRKELPPNTQ